MKLYIGADHRGYNLKEEIKNFLDQQKKDLGLEVVDVGNTRLDPDDDYPDFAARVAEGVARNSDKDRGILICGSGVGVDVVANKFKDIRSALIVFPDQAFSARNHDNVNVLSLPANFITSDIALKVVEMFLKTPFSDVERHQRRIDKIETIESKK